MSFVANLPTLPSPQIIVLKSFTEDFENFQNSNVEDSVPNTQEFVSYVRDLPKNSAAQLMYQTITEESVYVLSQYGVQLQNIVTTLKNSLAAKQPFVPLLGAMVEQLQNNIREVKRVHDSIPKKSASEFVEELGPNVESVARLVTTLTRYYRKVWKILTHFTTYSLYNFLGSLNITGACLWAALATFGQTAFMMSLFPPEEMPEQVLTDIKGIIMIFLNLMDRLMMSFSKFVYSSVSDTNDLTYQSFSHVLRSYIPNLLMFAWRNDGVVDADAMRRIWNVWQPVSPTEWQLFKAEISKKVFGDMPFQSEFEVFQFLPVGKVGQEFQGLYSKLVWPFTPDIQLKQKPEALEITPWASRSSSTRLKATTSEKQFAEAEQPASVAVDYKGVLKQKMDEQANLNIETMLYGGPATSALPAAATGLAGVGAAAVIELITPDGKKSTIKPSKAFTEFFLNVPNRMFSSENLLSYEQTGGELPVGTLQMDAEEANLMNRLYEYVFPPAAPESPPLDEIAVPESKKSFFEWVASFIPGGEVYEGPKNLEDLEEDEGDTTTEPPVFEDINTKGTEALLKIGSKSVSRAVDALEETFKTATTCFLEDDPNLAPPMPSFIGEDDDDKDDAVKQIGKMFKKGSKTLDMVDCDASDTFADKVWGLGKLISKGMKAISDE